MLPGSLSPSRIWRPDLWATFFERSLFDFIYREKLRGGIIVLLIQIKEQNWLMGQP